MNLLKKLTVAGSQVFLSLILVASALPVKAAESNSPYTPPTDTGINLDTIAIVGAVMYLFGLALFVYGKFFKKLVSKS